MELLAVVLAALAGTLATHLGLAAIEAWLPRPPVNVQGIDFQLQAKAAELARDLRGAA